MERDLTIFIEFAPWGSVVVSVYDDDHIGIGETEREFDSESDAVRYARQLARYFEREGDLACILLDGTEISTHEDHNPAKRSS